MKKVLATASTITLYAFSSMPAFADTIVDPCPKDNNFSKLCTFTGGSLGGLVGSVITAIFVIAVIIALAFLIFGGIKWILSGGDKAGVEGARNMIVASIVGLIIVFLSYFVLNLVLSLFGLSFTDLRIPPIKFN